ncbi:uncharacterized mitochondrial protein AtMg00810-like [Aristolochia californica]|uniref:uncharacterized mitochondrial protein AtMg00810-like n=1 Tax=Aristolochia californica TaxID=171875 RepID=UPI0035DA5DDC
MALTPLPCFSDLVSKAESFELFQQSLESSVSPVAAFIATSRGLDRSLIGTLQYLTITHPDIAYAVNSVSQFLLAPTEEHFFYVKRIFRYVKGTIHFGLTFCPFAIPGALFSYSDADWAGCLDTRHSTFGYSIYLGDNLISWSTKKQPTVSRLSCELSIVLLRTL